MCKHMEYIAITPHGLQRSFGFDSGVAVFEAQNILIDTSKPQWCFFHGVVTLILKMSIYFCDTFITLTSCPVLYIIVF